MAWSTLQRVPNIAREISLPHADNANVQDGAPECSRPEASAASLPSAQRQTAESSERSPLGKHPRSSLWLAGVEGRPGQHRSQPVEEATGTRPRMGQSTLTRGMCLGMTKERRYRAGVRHVCTFSRVATRVPSPSPWVSKHCPLT